MGLVTVSPTRVGSLGSLNADGSIATGVTTGTGAPIPASEHENWTVYITASAALSAGTVIVDEADQPGNSWSQVQSVTLSSPFASTGGMSAIHLPQATYAWLRVRIGTTVVGGTVAVSVRGQ